MEKAIRILYVENISTDAELVLHEISKNGIKFIHSIVETKSDYTNGLISFIPDLIISDYSLPNFDGMNALSLRNEISPQTPFILVTGSINKELAAECIKAGADDYVLKTDLKKLTKSITKAFERRDKVLLRLHAESDIQNKKAKIETSKHFSFPGNTENTIEDDTKDYELIDEKLTVLSMALKSAGIGTWVFDLRGNKGYFDKKARQLLGLTKGVFKSTEEEFLNCIHPDDRKEVKTLLLISMRKKSNFELEFRVSCDNEKVRFLTARVELITSPSGEPLRLNGFVWDITDLKILHITLQENIRKTNSIINNLNGVVYRCKFDDELTMEYISEGARELTGYPLWDFLNNRVRSFGSLIHQEDKKRVFKTIKEAIGKNEQFIAEFRIISSDGNVKWIWGSGRGVFEGKEDLDIEGFFTDITERKRTEEELKNSLGKLHQLTHHIEKVRENERVVISRELHDDLGQALTAVKIDLGSIKQSTTDCEVISKINKVSVLVSDTIKTVQRLTSELRPPIISDLGLKSAIEWYTKEFEQRNKILVFLDIDASVAITPESSLIIFRIMQEALTNIARHSKADRTIIKLFEKDGFVKFILSDNGVGFTEGQINSSKSFGIMSMKERADSIEGTFSISRIKNETIIKIIFPLIQNGDNEDFNL